MPEVVDTVTLDVSPAALFAYLDDPTNQTELTPGITEIRNVRPVETGGHESEYTYEMAGVELTGSVSPVEHEPDRRIRFEIRGRIDGEIAWTLEPVDGGTELTYAADYEIPGRVLSAAAAPLVRRYNERQVATTLEALVERFGRLEGR